MSLFDIYAGKKLGIKAYKDFNKWDEEWEEGVYSSTTGAKADYPGNVRNKNIIEVLPGGSYYFKAPSHPRVYYYDADKTYLSNEWVTKNTIKTIGDNVHYINFYIEGTAYSNNICINISKTTGSPKNGDYVPYMG